MASTKAARLVVNGVVQGVGFRPFVYRVAHERGVRGFVMNSSRGVVIEAEGDAPAVDAFARAVRDEAPPLARIESVEREEIVPGGFEGFEIRASVAVSSVPSGPRHSSRRAGGCPGPRNYR